jgi:hypothetical protein
MKSRRPRHEQTSFNQAAGRKLLQDMIAESEAQQAKRGAIPEPYPEELDAPTPEEVEARQRQKDLLQKQAERLGVWKR